MSKVEGLKALKDKLKAKLRKAKQGTADGKASVRVGYTQAYAIYVHENLTAFHPVGKAKFLEDPFKEMAPKVVELVKGLLAQGLTLPQALLIVGLRLQRESQSQVPVDTGALKSSAFTRAE